MIVEPSPTTSAEPELLVVMPVYNEQASLRKVAIEWFQEIANWTDSFVFLAINDGSTDGTAKLLRKLREQLGPQFEILEQKNCGHGQSCLRGYRIAKDRGAKYVFQIDSDGQCDPQYFFRFWRNRAKFDIIYGRRTRREDGWRRVVASLVLRTLLYVRFGANCVDANVPYRLMRTDAIMSLVEKIPPEFGLANIALAYLASRARLAEHSIPIRFRERYGGEPSVRMNQFGRKALELIEQIKTLKIN